MNDAPPVYDLRRTRDDDQLRLLSIFHFIFGGLALLGIGFLFLHYCLLSMVFSNPERWHARRVPEEFFHVFIWFYFILGAIFLTACVLNILSGIFLRQRKHRMFSLVIAGLNCIQIPVGTALGVFTILVLLRDSVRQSYTS